MGQVTASVLLVTLAAVKEDANAATTARAVLVAANVALRANNVLLAAPAPAKAVANVVTTANARAALVSRVVSTNLPFLSAPSHWRRLLHSENKHVAPFRTCRENCVATDVKPEIELKVSALGSQK